MMMITVFTHSRGTECGKYRRLCVYLCYYDRVRDLGVILDNSMSMRQHIAKVTSTCFFHLRRLRKIGKVLDQDNRNRLVCAFILHASTTATLCLLDYRTLRSRRCNVSFMLLLDLSGAFNYETM